MIRVCPNTYKTLSALATSGRVCANTYRTLLSLAAVDSDALDVTFDATYDYDSDCKEFRDELGIFFDALRKTSRTLQYLCFSGKALQPDCVELLFQSLLENEVNCCASLETLHLYHQGLGLVAAGHLSSFIPHLTSLKSLWLDGNALDDSCMQVLCPALSCLVNLQRLDLRWNDIGDTGVLALCAAFPALKNLKELWLEVNSFGELGIRMLLKAAAKDLSSVEGLDIGVDKYDFVGFPAGHISERNLIEYLRLHPFHLACGIGDVQEAREQLCSGFDVNQQDQVRLFQSTSQCDLERQRTFDARNSGNRHYFSRPEKVRLKQFAFLW